MRRGRRAELLEDAALDILEAMAPTLKLCPKCRRMLKRINTPNRERGLLGVAGRALEAFDDDEDEDDDEA